MQAHWSTLTDMDADINQLIFIKTPSKTMRFFIKTTGHYTATVTRPQSPMKVVLHFALSMQSGTSTNSTRITKYSILP